ncbi:hypothetical protein DFH06DRAFT_1296271 [Mycena polygramma]|nr:hypothetical protein DFH06DRAFT_1296271 [Mycena polygramma]
MAQPVLLRRLLPKPRSESFTLEMVQRATDSQSKPNRCSLAQQRRREREAQENTKPVASESSKLRRSAAQRARRQRELAAVIERDLQSANTIPRFGQRPKNCEDE